MEHLFDGSLPLSTIIFLVGALLVALVFEFINGFHDTANAVATVIYTNSLRPTTAVVWSGICNFAGVYIGGVAVAYGIVNLLPVELLVSVSDTGGFAMVFAMLFAAITWNLGTWYFAIPASSSHTMIGSVLGVGLMHSIMTPGLSIADGVNWSKAMNVGASLLLSPLFGFAAAATLLLVVKKLIRDPRLFSEPLRGTPPPMWIRSILILTCTGVSLGHGSNDGQKGIGLMMLILIGILPASYAIDPSASASEFQALRSAAVPVQQWLQSSPASSIALNKSVADDILVHTIDSKKVSDSSLAAVSLVLSDAVAISTGAGKTTDIDEARRTDLRKDLVYLSRVVALMSKNAEKDASLPAAELKALKKGIDRLTEYSTGWIKFAVALALGIGTMIGWKRVVVTIGEKIGKSHLTYAQGASAEMVAASTIALADGLGLPVSTTQVLSSGVAGTMFANKSGIQGGTIRSIGIAWILTFPVSMGLAAGLYWLFLTIAG